MRNAVVFLVLCSLLAIAVLIGLLKTPLPSQRLPSLAMRDMLNLMRDMGFERHAVIEDHTVSVTLAVCDWKDG